VARCVRLFGRVAAAVLVVVTGVVVVAGWAKAFAAGNTGTDNIKAAAVANRINFVFINLVFIQISCIRKNIAACVDPCNFKKVLQVQCRAAQSGNAEACDLSRIENQSARSVLGVARCIADCEAGAKL
jgi:hypothetical protein